MTHRMLEIPGYRLHKRLGKGGMAEVYLATQLSLDREVGVKVLLRTEDAAFTERFIQEGHIVASLRHPAIITIHDIGQIADGRHPAMEYLGGGDRRSIAASFSRRRGLWTSFASWPAASRWCMTAGWSTAT